MPAGLRLCLLGAGAGAGLGPPPSPGSPPVAEHPGECPRAEPCWDTRRRRGSQCLDDSVCRRQEKCCDTGCGWECVAVPRGRGHTSGDKADGQCVEECQTDSQCPRGQRCTSISCGHISGTEPRFPWYPPRGILALHPQWGPLTMTTLEP
uniref:WAP domain-containing protein n=1 Tax=Cyanistes caeruleus TaxID=156563 RepID=A0A8C0U7R9_CYACU